jgi:hypothetical protein
VWPFSFERSTGLTIAGVIVGLGVISSVVKIVKATRSRPAS